MQNSLRGRGGVARWGLALGASVSEEVFGGDDRGIDGAEIEEDVAIGVGVERRDELGKADKRHYQREGHEVVRDQRKRGLGGHPIKDNRAEDGDGADQESKQDVEMNVSRDAFHRL